ncbi:MAG TPA: glycosyltransferase family 39 protein [Chloroflexota bacterium]|nr:glycosyltransferase family 39 protein [Chloroflexota bacterium]
MLGLLVAGVTLRVIAALQTGALVDELTYQYLGASVWKHDIPEIRPEFGQLSQPFLWHPPFFFFLLGRWFSLWGNDGLVTARLLSVVVSAVMLCLVYIVARKISGARVALLALFLIALDPWLILINQAVYIENSQMVLTLLAIWAYWGATRQDANANKGAYILRYALAGFAVGVVVIYKHIGAYLLLAVFVNLLLTRGRHRLGHVYLLATAAVVLAIYSGAMHTIFGSLFDQETIAQVRRTLGLSSAPGLNYGPVTAATAIVQTYWIFPITILTLLAGALAAGVCVVRQAMGKRQGETLILSWAVAAVISGAGIALKSPHYFILWLIPLYLLLSEQTPAVIVSVTSRLRKERRYVAWETGAALALVLVLNLWSFHARFMSGASDSLESAVAYVNTHVPSNAIVAVDASAGPDLTRPYRSFPADTRKELYRRRAQYLFLYWSLTNPIPVTLGDISTYCIQSHRFDGFNDHVQVCRLIVGRLSPQASRAGDDDVK